MDLLGVSGGIDSMYLAGTYLGNGRPFGIAHCNFCLRGGESDGDEAFVREWAEAHGIPCHVARFDTRAYASEHGVSFEMAARELRYRFFAETAVAHGYDAVVVAHNANDNAETLLLNLLRGTGLRGACGMKAVSTLPLPDCRIPLLRPLLGITRDEIASRMAGLPYREDRTNAENDVKRNRIRNLVFPVFKDINPSFVETLARDMARFADAQAIVDAYFAEHPEEAAGHPASAPEGADGFDVPPPETPVRYTITEEPWDGTESVVQPAGTLILDADRLPGAMKGCAQGIVKEDIPRSSEDAAPAAALLEECFWTPGDWIRPLGAGGRKKLQDWFTDHHIPIPLKHATPLLRAAQPSGDPHHILVIVGHTIDDSLRVTPSTRRILRIVALPPH